MSSGLSSPVLHSYVVDTDSGFAPNTTDDICTLATCKQVIRREATEGDWVLGTNPRSHGEEGITYLMSVGEVLTYSEYFSCGRFEFKKPENDPVGDNIYYRNEEGDLTQVQNPPYHGDIKSRKKDLSSDRVLVADQFWYFGDQSPELPPSLCENVIKGYKSSSRNGRKKPTVHLDELVEWVSERYEPGMHGTPRDESNNSCGCGETTQEDKIC